MTGWPASSQGDRDAETDFSGEKAQSWESGGGGLFSLWSGTSSFPIPSCPPAPPATDWCPLCPRGCPGLSVGSLTWGTSTEVSLPEPTSTFLSRPSAHS